MKIVIKGEEFNVKYSMRAMFIWEQIMKRNFNLETTLDNYAYFYSLVLASNPDKILKWDDFIDEVDVNPAIASQIMEYLIDYNKNQQIFNDENAKKITGDEKKN